MRSFRVLTSIVTASAALVVLAACGQNTPSTQTSATPGPSASASGTPSASSSPTPSVKIPVSNNLDAITVSGAYGKAPTVKFKTPFGIDQTRVKVLDANPSGAVATATDSVTVNYYGVDGRTGKTFDQSFDKGKPVTFSLAEVIAGFKKGLVGQHQGSRVLIAMPGPDGYDAAGGRPDSGINVGDTLLFVVDITDVPLTGPAGTKVTPKDGLPTVTDANGVPTVTVPKTAQPTALQVQPLITGTGAKVAATDTITINYRWYSWSGQLLEDTYATKKPASTPLSALLTGLQKGLTGQPVGSRVLIVVPDAYPSGNATPAVKPGEASVFVVDILFRQAGQ